MDNKFLKKMGLYLLPVIAPLLFIGILENLLSTAEVKLFVENPENRELLSIQQCRYGTKNVDDLCQFNERDPSDSQKLILVFGDSTAAGYPDYQSNNFSSLLEQSLNKDGPNNYRVENYASSCKDTEFVRRCFSQSLKAKPDMVVIYSGHNDFSNRFHPHAVSTLAQKMPWIFDLITYLRFHSRTYAFATDILGDNKKSHGVYKLDSEKEFQARHTEVVDQYMKTMQDITSLAKDHQIKIALITPVSNLTGFTTPPREIDNPFFEMKRKQTIEFITNGNSKLKESNKEAALVDFIKARDNDPVPSRLTLAAYQQLKNNFSQSDNIVLVDFEKELEATFLKEHQFGCDLFGQHQSAPCDQFHLNAKGHQLLSDFLLKNIQKKWPLF